MKKITFKLNMVGGISKWNFPSSIVPVLFIFLVLNLFTTPLSAQNVAINSTGATGNSSAILDLNTGNSGTMGFLPPQLALTSITTPAPAATAIGLLIYNTATVANVVTPGYYYWNGASWFRVNDNNPTAGYGYNIQTAIGATDVSTSATAFSAMAADMSITFTPVHSVVFLDFSASGITNLSSTNIETVNFEVLVNGAAPAGGIGYGASTIAQEDYFAHPGTGWSCSIVIPITGLTPGTPVTISIDWCAKARGGTRSLIENYASSLSSQCHRSMVITD